MPPATQRQLFVCCDGTWFKPEARFPSHVGRIAKLAATRPGGERDLVYYTRGVGSRYGLDKWIGGGFGEGLDTNVKDAYNFLAHNYIPPSKHYAGDKIFMFGFSRGAYTVRSLAAMIDRVGLLKRGSVMCLGDAYRAFRTKPGETALDEQGAPISLQNEIHTVDIDFVGVFDTVGAKGIPFLWFDQTRRFTDLDLPARVKYGRHAMALNEPRSQFRPAVWEGVCPRPAGEAAPTKQARVAQVWFAGVHSDVGGGYDRTAMGNNGHLGAHTLRWMLDEARECGLKFDEEEALRLVTGLEPKLSNTAANSHNFNLHDSMSLMYFVLDKILYLQRLIMRADFRFHRRYVKQSAAVHQSIHISAAEAYLRDAAVKPDDPLEHSLLLSHKWALGKSVRRFRFSRNVELRALDLDDQESHVIDLETAVRAEPGIAKRVAGVVVGLAGFAAIFAAMAGLVLKRHELWDLLPEGVRPAVLIALLIAAMPPLWTPYLLFKRLYSYRYLR